MTGLSPETAATQGGYPALHTEVDGGILLEYAGSTAQGVCRVKHPAVCFVLLLSSLTLAAQNQVKTEAPTLVFHGDTVGNGCPIGMVASQGVWDHTVKVRQGEQERSIQPFGQRISLTLADSHPAPIIAATVKVHGLTGKNHMLETLSSVNGEGDAVKTMKITFPTSSKGGVSSDLYIPGFTSVSSVELLEVSYDDGMVWKIGGSSGCRVTPDRMMLIANH